MSAYSGPFFLAQRPARRSKIPSCLMAVIFAALACLVFLVLATVALSRLIAPFSILATPLGLASLPGTPSSFGLSGQASCRTTAPPTLSSWLNVAVNDAQKYQIDAGAFTWQIWQESHFNPDAVSSAGAIGIAQFLPSTAASLGIDPRDPAQSLDAAAHLDAERVQQYAPRALQLAQHYGGSSAHYAYGLALAAYNGGAGAVEGAWKRSFAPYGVPLWPGDAWDWLAHMGQETQQYVPAILGCL
jgi:soluble lytic murein transglycosylase-like protein